jgi:cell division septum initiation protein DivIVA
MERGTQFLKSQVNSAVMQHGVFLRALEVHEDQAEDDRFRDLCSRHIPQMREHQRMLEEYQSQLGAEVGTGKNIIGVSLGAARDLADSARESDFLRLVADIAMARKAEDTFKTFREAGKMMGYHTLHEIGEIGERHHDAYVKEANRLAQHMFVENVQDVDRFARRPAAPSSKRLLDLR